MLFNTAKCKALTLDYVNTASGLDLHRFNWLESEELIGEIKGSWNHLIGVSENPPKYNNNNLPSLMHWTLGGPWFKDQRFMGGELAAAWFRARDDMSKLWD